MAAPRTMILFDPDLDTDLSPQAKLPKRSGDTGQTATLRGQRIPSRQTLARFLREGQSAVKLRGHVSVLLTTDAAMRRLNRQFRGKNKATDVLSFPAAKLSQVSKARSRSHRRGPVAGDPAPGAPRIQAVAGDLAISIPTAGRQAKERGHSLTIEIKVLMLHGLLHLAGYDHETDEGEMARREQKLRLKLRLPHGLIERTTKHSQKTAGAKAHCLSESVSARLKSCPDTKRPHAAAYPINRPMHAPKGSRR